MICSTVQYLLLFYYSDNKIILILSFSMLRRTSMLTFFVYEISLPILNNVCLTVCYCLPSDAAESESTPRHLVQK